MPLSDREKTILLRLAREAIKRHLDGKVLQAVPDELPNALGEKLGAFVTITKGGRLAGCTGFVAPEKNLYETVIDAAFSTAFEDQRFSPVTISDLPHIVIEISILTPSSPVESWRDIEVSRHGIIMSKNGYRSLFLPQVAKERGWDIKTTLSRLSEKAGLSTDDWRDGASFEVFEAIKFCESDFL